ncbi:MAG: hypothetical protein QM488_18535 [Rhizobiaceae bacterium]
MLVDDVTKRISEKITVLEGRVKSAADLAELVRQKKMPQSSVAAFVLPLGLRPRDQGNAGTGYFIQSIDDTIGIILVIRNANDITGGKALPTIETLRDELITNLAGWIPGDEIGGFRVSRGQLLSAIDGTVIYQLDFTIQIQVRNT